MSSAYHPRISPFSGGYTFIARGLDFGRQVVQVMTARKPSPKKKKSAKTRAAPWTPERKAKAIDRILEGVAEGKSVASLIVGDKSLPSFPTWYEWLREAEGLAKNYARAMEARADITFDRLADLAGQVREGEIDPQAAKVAADIEKWTLARMSPKKYGERSGIDLTSSDGSMSPAPAVDLSGLTGEMVERLERAVFGCGAARKDANRPD